MLNSLACSFDRGSLIKSFSGEWVLALYLPDENPAIIRHRINRVFGEIVTVELTAEGRAFILDLPQNEVTYALRGDLIGGQELTIFIMGRKGRMNALSCASLTVCQQTRPDRLNAASSGRVLS